MAPFCFFSSEYKYTIGFNTTEFDSKPIWLASVVSNRQLHNQKVMCWIDSTRAWSMLYTRHIQDTDAWRTLIGETVHTIYIRKVQSDWFSCWRCFYSRFVRYGSKVGQTSSKLKKFWTFSDNNSVHFALFALKKFRIFPFSPSLISFGDKSDIPDYVINYTVTELYRDLRFVLTLGQNSTK